MPRYRLTIAYDGTDFCGWQKQEPPAEGEVAPGKVLGALADEDAAGGSPADGSPAGGAAGGGSNSPPRAGVEGAAAERPRIALRTVQAVVERAVREAVREPVEVVGASRTDAGVHARGQVAAFMCGWPVERGTDALLRAINSRLPEDVLVLSAEEAGPGFNPIGDCTAKGYSYTLHVSPHRALWDRRFVHHVWTPLDVAAMNAAAAVLVGEHDFAAFAAAGHGRQSTVRRVYECRVVEEGTGALEEGTEARRHVGTKGEATGGTDFDRRWAGGVAPWGGRVRIEVSGSGFLWNMVRIIGGTLVEAGRGKLTPADVAAAIESGDRRRAGPTLPAQGLCLEWVRY